MSEINSTHLDRTGAVPRATVVIVITRAVLAAALAGALATLVAACQNEGPATQTRRQAVQTADPDEAAFLAASGAPLPWSDAPPISLRRSPTGTVSAVFGSELSVQQQSLGCLAAGPEAAARCFLGAFAGSFGIGNVIDQLGTGEDRTRAGGIRVVRFGQVHEGRPVFGRHIDVVMNQGLEVIGAFSTLALPLDAPPATSVQAALAAYQPGIAGDLVRASTGVDDLTEEASHATLWPVLSGDRYQAVAAMAVVYGSASRERRVLALVDATTSAVLEVRSQTATDLPVRDMRGFAVHDQMDGHSFHLECDDDDDCEGTNWFCSDQFDPKRCVARCLTDADCDDFQHYDCFPVAGNLELGGYCYWRPEGSQTGYTVHNSGTGWYNSVLADHKAYAHIKESLDAVTQWHRDTCGVVNSYDGHGGDYKVDIHAQCYGCDECADPPCPCDDEYSACGGAHGSVSFGDPTVNLGYWYGIWSSATPSGKAWAEHVMGHEFGHVLVGSGYGWKVDWPRGCVSESAADTYGVLFSVMRLGTADQWSGCGGFDTDAWRDDRAGLHPGCHSGLLKSYAYRSRFDLLRCAGEVIRHGPACLADADCPAYQSCVYFDDTGTRDCAEPAAGHWGGEIFVRLARILSEGAGVFHADGHEEDLGIPDSPLGQHTTARILSEANRSLSASADEEHWMGQILFWASVEGAYAVTSRALGAVGFFPDRISLDTRVTDRGPVKARWSDYQGSTYSKDFTAFKYGNDVLVRYLVGAGDRAELMGADTEHRPVVVGYHDFLHVFWLDKASKTIRVSILNQNGSRWYGPYIVDPGEGQLRPNGAFDATVWQDRLYLVFGDATNHDRLTLAWCYDPARCTRFNWHEFTTGVYKRQVHNMSVLAGPAAVGTAQVNGRPWDEDSLWIFFADAGTNVGALYLSRVDAADVLQSTKPVPGYYPSFKTDAPVGIAAKASAFGQTCYPEGVPTPCDRMYLYLIWRDRSGKDIYTSVFQDADAARFTRSQPAFYRANLSTGVSWTKGALPGDYLQGMYTDAKLSQPNQLHGYGRY